MSKYTHPEPKGWLFFGPEDDLTPRVQIYFTPEPLHVRMWELLFGWTFVTIERENELHIKYERDEGTR